MTEGKGVLIATLIIIFVCLGIFAGIIDYQGKTIENVIIVGVAALFGVIGEM